MDDLESRVAELYATALPRLCAYGYLLTGSQSEAEDLVQAAVVKVFARRPRFDGVRGAEAYVRAAMRTLRIDAARRDSLWRRVMPGQAPRGDAPDVADEVADADEVSTALRSLTPRVRVAAALRYYDDLPVEEIAREMGVTEGTVKTLLHRARGALSRWLEPEGESVPVGERTRGAARRGWAS